MLLGLDAPSEALSEAFRSAADCDLVKGFAVGRTIFGEPARAWLERRVSDQQVVDQMAERFGTLVECWSRLRPAH